MTQRRAFWEALLTVCAPSFALWTAVAIVLNWKQKVSYSEGIPIYLFLFLLPLPLIFPVYRRYLKGPQPIKPVSRRWYLTLGALYGAIAVIFIVAAIPPFRNRVVEWSQLAMAFFWGAMCVDHLYRAAKLKAAQPSSEQQHQSVNE